METKEEIRSIVEGSVGGTVIGQLEELYINAGSDTPVVIDTVAKTLTIVQDNYHLVPKVKIAEDYEFVQRDTPDGAIVVLLAEIWMGVSS